MESLEMGILSTLPRPRAKRRQHFNSNQLMSIRMVALASSVEMTWRGSMDSFYLGQRGSEIGFGVLNAEMGLHRMDVWRCSVSLGASSPQNGQIEAGLVLARRATEDRRSPNGPDRQHEDEGDSADADAGVEDGRRGDVGAPGGAELGDEPPYLRHDQQRGVQRVGGRQGRQEEAAGEERGEPEAVPRSARGVYFELREGVLGGGVGEGVG
ncbi:ENTH/VHS/GAT family protein [Actinidia rufa]|uniref:ENTH/VHS/GAT family protein n=1 Tax=Actinidia rufa TaxID=165716 RepID=A0A7J0GRS3_9ERIC|nr:ENTH/VHS/GAT family protein [Actinidia rufa]